MGKSAKLHKRKGKSTSSFAAQSKSQSNPSVAHAPVQVDKVSDSKKKADKSKLKSKRPPKGEDGYVLGDADYVTLMMGGRAKARQEALKLPPPEK
ncbi:hypothetical protein RhiJN_23888 [Ceratobasidium sp. AG-Ba]|nr:hypothetical protein RhiJN_23888 [Ceratobasidium sp. AG-Ba]